MAQETISPSDRSSLTAERGPINMSVGGAMVFAAGDGLEYDRVAERLADRLHLVPRYRQRIEQPPLGLAQPVWVDDEGFDLQWHLRRATVDGMADLERYIAREMSHKLDRSRPLWELHVIDGLEDGRRALLPKMHHALVDGLAAVGIGMLLLDPTPEPAEIPKPDGMWNPRAYDRRKHMMRLATMPLERAQRLVVEGTLRALDTSPRRAAEDLKRASDLVTELARQRPQAPMTPFNVPVTPNRRFATLDASLADIKEAGRRNGGTVNDVILAAVTGMVARYLHRAGVDLKGRLPVALVPVSIRRESEREEVGNRISTVFVDLPVDELSPSRRIRRIGETMRELRGSAAVAAGALIAGATGQAPPVVSSVLVRAIGSVRAMNLVVSNVPGPQSAWYLNGTQLEQVFPAVPLNPANQAFSVGILSYNGRVCFGLLADATLDPPLDVARAALSRSLDEVLRD